MLRQQRLDIGAETWIRGVADGAEEIASLDGRWRDRVPSRRLRQRDHRRHDVDEPHLWGEHARG
jgi:hypothetical protein